MLASRTSSLRRMSTHVVTIGKSVPKNKVRGKTAPHLPYLPYPPLMLPP